MKSPSKEQVNVGEVASRIVMMWIAFGCAVAATIIFLAFFARCVLKHDDLATKAVVGVITGFLLHIDLVVYKSLFPGASKA